MRPARHSGAKVSACVPQNGDHTRSHVLARMIPGTFHHCEGTAISHCKSLSYPPGHKKTSARGAVEYSIACNNVIMPKVIEGFWRDDDDLPARHSLGHVIVSFTLQSHLHPFDAERPKALTGRACITEL